MMSGISRYVAVVSLSCGFASALGLSMAHTSVNAQTSAPPTVVPKVPAVAKLAPTPKVLTGTLFNTHEQRERLDRTRLRGGTIGDETVVTAEPERPVINGFVKRSDKRDTVWVDDVMKRDPRAEVVERLEPNMVGGMSRGLGQLTATNLQSKARASSATISNRHYAGTKVRHSKKARLRRSFKNK
jgi:hypothetical protein